MKTGVMLFAGDPVHEGPVAIVTRNETLPGLVVERTIISPGCTFTQTRVGSQVVSIFGGVAVAEWTEPGEPSQRLKVLEGELLMLKPGTMLRLENLEDEPFIYTTTEVQSAG